MHPIVKFMAWIKGISTLSENNRQYKLINTISIELIILGLLLIYINFLWRFWAIVSLLTIACGLILLNLLILRQTKNLAFCGHLLTILVLIVTTLGNYWLGNLSAYYFGWYYVIPILAAVTIGWRGLVIYATICLGIIVLFSQATLTPIYVLSATDIMFMSYISLSFSLFIIVTTLYNVLRENEQYEKVLQESNYMLQADKDKFHYLARYDALTNLPNRSYFQTYLQNMIESTNIQTHCVTVFYMDLDKFKDVNDYSGHEAGDALLLQASKRLQSCFRERDFLARLGGDEFTAIINHLNEDNVPKAIAERILLEFGKPFEIAGRQIICNISIGIASYPLDTLEADALVAKADEAMYFAKRAGGNCYAACKQIQHS